MDEKVETKINARTQATENPDQNPLLLSAVHVALLQWQLQNFFSCSS